MRPLRLVLDGFGSYRHAAEIDFSDVDYFALVGPTGSGKSTIVDALCFALYGTVPRWDNEKEVRNALAPSTNACQVALIFEVAGARYVAARSLQRDRRGNVTTRAARLERLDDGVRADAPLEEVLQASAEQIAEGPDRVKAGVQQLLGLSYEHFTQSVLLPQGDFAQFLRAKPADRQRLLVELLAFGVYKEVGQRARERAQAAQAKQQAARHARDRLADATPAAEAAARSRLEALTRLAHSVDASLAELAELNRQAAAGRQLVADAESETGLLAAIRAPADAEGLAQQVAAADVLVAQCRERRVAGERNAAEADARRRALPERADVQRQVEMHALRAELLEEVGQQEQALTACRASEDRLGALLADADRQLARAADAREGARQAHAAAGLALTLHAGEPCPVCRQTVATLPPRQAPADLDAAVAAADAAAGAQRRAQAAHQEAAKTTAAAAAALSATRARLDKAAQVMAEVLAEAELGSLLAAIDAAEDGVRRARGEATACQTELAAAEKSRTALVAQEQRAWAALTAARDPVVRLGAPPVSVGGEDLTAAWTALTGWAAAEREVREHRLPELRESAAKLGQRLEDATDALAGLLAEHGITEAQDAARIPAVVAGHRVRAETQLSQIRADLKQAARLDQQIAACATEAQVAALLGNLLRANSFEAWLCSEALDSLVIQASATLMELSGGRYELDRDERNELVVVDYSDAGARRPVQTLSGGETFQASLALALALSRQVIGLSAGRRELNSMFLDEGFGSLDADTLETVAGTLERLAADSDRMVGVVTHVTELAERVPVRFVVSRTPASSEVTKERA